MNLVPVLVEDNRFPIRIQRTRSRDSVAYPEMLPVGKYRLGFAPRMSRSCRKTRSTR